jgi:hypothetical protein
MGDLGERLSRPLYDIYEIKKSEYILDDLVVRPLRWRHAGPKPKHSAAYFLHERFDWLSLDFSACAQDFSNPPKPPCLCIRTL